MIEKHNYDMTDDERLSRICVDRKRSADTLNSLHACRVDHPLGRNNNMKWRNAMFVINGRCRADDWDWLQAKAKAESEGSMLEITNAEASVNILRFADEGRLTQSKWHDHDKEGREIACLLGAIHPSVTSPTKCNGALMPMWLAELTPVLFDGIPAAEIIPIAKRYGGLVAHWRALSPQAWERVLNKFLTRTIDEAVDATRPVSEGKPYWPAIEAACKQCKDAIGSGDAEKKERAAEAARAAEAPWTAPWMTVAWAAAWAAKWGTARAEVAAWAAVDAATWAARTAAKAAPEARAAAVGRTAGAALYLRLFTFLLDQIETECP